MLIKFYLPEKVSSNAIYSGVHWTKRKKLKDLYRKVNFVAKPVENYPVDIVFTFFFKRKMDTSNCAYMVKLIEDCLVKKGVLADDSFKYVRQITINQDKGDDYCLIDIKEVF